MRIASLTGVMTCHLWFPYFLLLLEASIASANVEKIIFRGPEPIEVPSQHPTLSDLKLQLLSPDSPVLRTSLHTQFASNDLPNGVASWYLLENLTKGQLYEVRICWAATVSFQLKQTQHLLTSTATFIILTHHSRNSGRLCK